VETKTKKQVYTDKQYKLTKDIAPLTFMLPTKNSARNPLLWFDDEKGENRELRYARNQNSPFVDEQDGNAILEPIVFEDGFLYVSKNNQVLQKFLHHHPMNGPKFVEVDKAKDAVEEVEDIMLEADALIEAKKLSIDQLENVCRVLFNTDVTKMSTAELKRDVLMFAKNYPSEFMDVISDPELKMTATIQKFFGEGLLTFRKSGKEVWFNTKANKTKLMNIPFGKDGMDLVVSYMKSDDGIEHLKYLEGLIE
jgi:hypothetical protein